MILALFLVWFSVTKKLYVLLIPTMLIFIYFAIEADSVLLSAIFISISVVVIGLVYFNSRD